LGSWLKITEEAHISGLLLSRVKGGKNFDKKWVGLHFGRLFTQTHLVSLILGDFGRFLDKFHEASGHTVRAEREQQ
jgi:hypothetical protein